MNTGTVECDASIMNGETLHHTAIGAVAGIKNPIEVVHRMLQSQTQILPGGLIQPRYHIIHLSKFSSFCQISGIETSGKKN